MIESLLRHNLKNASVLVTGSSGFIASALIPALYQHGAKVFGVSRNNNTQSKFTVNNFCCDIKDSQQINDVVAEVSPQYVFHLAGNKHRGVLLEDFHESIAGNVLGTLNIAEACLQQGGLEHFIHLGSCEEYGEASSPCVESDRESPVTAYSCSKVAATHLLQTVCKVHDFPLTILRPSLVYGPNQGGEMFIPALILSLLEGKSFAMSEGKQTRDFIFINDLIEGMLKAAVSTDRTGGIINFSSGRSVQILEVVKTVAEIMKCDVNCLIKIGEVPYRVGDVMSYQISNQKACLSLDWQAKTALREGLMQTIHYYQTEKRQSYAN